MATAISVEGRLHSQTLCRDKRRKGPNIVQGQRSEAHAAKAVVDRMVPGCRWRGTSAGHVRGQKLWKTTEFSQHRQSAPSSWMHARFLDLIGFAFSLAGTRSWCGDALGTGMVMLGAPYLVTALVDRGVAGPERWSTASAALAPSCLVAATSRFAFVRNTSNQRS